MYEIGLSGRFSYRDYFWRGLEGVADLLKARIQAEASLQRCPQHHLIATVERRFRISVLPQKYLDAQHRSAVACVQGGHHIGHGIGEALDANKDSGSLRQRPGQILAADVLGRVLIDPVRCPPWRVVAVDGGFGSNSDLAVIEFWSAKAQTAEMRRALRDLVFAPA
jgi:hypothetical protein